MLEFIILFVLFYVWHALGITIGYHRLLSHRTFQCSKPLEYLLVLPGYLAFEGSPIWWSTIHRAHHRHVDTELDPHSPRFGFMHSLFGWLVQEEYPSHIDPSSQSKDLVNDPVYRFLEQGGSWKRSNIVCFAVGAIFRLSILLLFGWVPALASLLAGIAVLQIPLMLNVICHLPKFGYKNYSTDEDSVNVPIIGLLALGEGWHNNHHAAPGSARSGMKPWELDISWIVIKALRKVGLVWKVNEIPHERLIAKFGEPSAPKVEEIRESQDPISKAISTTTFANPAPAHARVRVRDRGRARSEATLARF